MKTERVQLEALCTFLRNVPKSFVAETVLLGQQDRTSRRLVVALGLRVEYVSNRHLGALL